MRQNANGKCKTIDDFVRIGKTNSIQWQNSSYYTSVNGIVMEDFNIFRDRYYPKLMGYLEDYTMDSERFTNEFKYRPKALSYELYGTIDYWYLLLIVNQMCSAMQFTKKKIKVISQNGIAYIKAAMLKEESNLEENKLQVNIDYKEQSKSYA